MSLFAESNNDSRSVPNIDGCDGLPVEGSTVAFSCPPGLKLIRPTSATCIKNGEWQPDPKGLVCNDSTSKSYTEGS